MISMFNVNVPKAVDQPLLKVLHSGYIAQGPKVEEFEKEFADFIDNPNCVALNSGTSALTLALRLADVGPGDEVITTAMTCTATNLPIVAAGAKVVWADVASVSGLIDPKSIEKLINPWTKAIMVCDWGGEPADLKAIMAIAKQWGIKVIEDAAHALGSIGYDGDLVGNQADFTCFSFQAIKHLTTGDGGMLVCRDPKDTDRAKRLRWFGIERKEGSLDSRIEQDIQEWGYKFHMNDLAATMGIVGLENLEKVIIKHRQIASYYDNNLKLVPHVSRYRTGRSSSWLYTIVLPNESIRNKLIEHMKANDIQVSQVHRRNDEYTVFETAKNHQDFRPGLDLFSKGMVCLPVHAGMTKADRKKVVRVFNEFEATL